MSQTTKQKAFQLFIFAILIGLCMPRPNGNAESQVNYLFIRPKKPWLNFLFVVTFIFIPWSRKPLIISQTSLIWRKYMLFINHCSTTHIMMSRICQIEPSSSFVPVIQVVHSEAVAAAAEMQQAYQCGIQTVNWCQSAKLAIDNATSIQFHVSESKFLNSQSDF